MKTTLATDKVRLGLAITPIGKSAHRASLAGMSGVNGDDLDTEGFSLVLQEILELSKTPRMKSPFSLASFCLDSGANIGEVFNHDSGASRCAFQDRCRENVVTIPSKALLTPSEASKVPFGALRTIGLQSLPQSESPFDDFLPVGVSVKAVIRTNGRTSHSEVYTDSLPVRREGNIRQFDNDMQIIPSLAVYQVGCGGGIADSVISIFRQEEGNVLSASSGGKVDGLGLPIHFECMKVIAWWAISRLGIRNLTPLLGLAYSGLNRFRSLLPRLDMQVGDKSGISVFTISVSQSMQSVGVAISLLPSYFTDLIKRSRELVSCIFQCLGLFFAGIKSHSYCSIHKGMIPYTLQNMQTNILRKELDNDDKN